MFRDSDPSKAVEIVEEHGSFLLIRTASGFAVIEKRNDRIYPISQSEHEGVPGISAENSGLPNGIALLRVDLLDCHLPIWREIEVPMKAVICGPAM
jgi:hypothetical protein